MKDVTLTTSNFRGINSAELLFNGHILMVGSTSAPAYCTNVARVDAFVQ